MAKNKKRNKDRKSSSGGPRAAGFTGGGVHPNTVTQAVDDLPFGRGVDEPARLGSLASEDFGGVEVQDSERLGLTKIIKQGYDALKPSSTRSMRSGGSTYQRTEDWLIRHWTRLSATELVRDLARNSSLFNQLIEYHIQHTCKFDFTPLSEDTNFNEYCYRRYRIWKDEMDYSGRFSLEEFIEKVERLRVMDGDCAVIHQDGKYRIVESRFIRNMEGDSTTYQYLDGIVQGLQFCNGQYVGLSVIFDPACEPVAVTKEESFFIAYKKYAEQARGVSPLLTGLNDFIDIRENMTYALGKAKLGQILGLVIHAKGARSREMQDVKFDFNKGQEVLRLAENEKAEFISPNTPEREFQEFMEQAALHAFACLSVPYSFFSGKNVAEIQFDDYREACASKQRNLLELLGWMFKRELQKDLIEGKLEIFGIDKYDLDGFKSKVSDIRFVGKLYPQTYLLRYLDAFLKARQMGLILDGNLPEIYGDQNGPDPQKRRIRDTLEAFERDQSEFENGLAGTGGGGRTSVVVGLSGTHNGDSNLAATENKSSTSDNKNHAI